jgi:hypothetical protein
MAAPATIPAAKAREIFMSAFPENERRRRPPLVCVHMRSAHTMDRPWFLSGKVR